MSGLSKRPESTTQGVRDKTKQQIEQAQKTGQQISPALAEQYVREVTASKNANGAVNLTVQREGANLIVGGDGLQNATIDLSTLDSYSSLSIARNGLADHFGDSWYGSSAGRDLNLRFMTAQHDVMEKTLNTSIHESVSYQAGMARGYNNAAFHARDRIAQQQRFAVTSRQLNAMNQAVYDRDQARASMSTLDKVQLGLDVTGMSEIPVVSQLADLGSAGISLYNGDYVGAGLSMGSMIPVAGKAFEGTRAARFAENIASRGAELRGKYSHLSSGERQAIISGRLESIAANRLDILEGAIPKAHFKGRHGAQTTLDQQYNRAVNGIDPITNKVRLNRKGELVTPNSTRFLSHRDQINAIERASTIYKNTGVKAFAERPINFRSSAGEGFYGKTGGYDSAFSAQVWFNKNQQPITAFPILGK